MPIFVTIDMLPEPFRNGLGDNYPALLACGQLVYIRPGEFYTTKAGTSNVGPSPYGGIINNSALVDPLDRSGLPACPGEAPQAISVNEDDSLNITTSIDTTTGLGQIVDGGSTIDTGGRFCGTEERVSTHTCNSQNPAAAIDAFGNIGVAWHDTRDGTHEIYFKALASKISQAEALEALAARQSELGRTIRTECSPEESILEGGADLEGYDAGNRCREEIDADGSGVQVRGDNGSLSINVTGRTMTLSTTDEGIDFFEAGIQAGSLLRIETGLNANTQIVVASVVGSSALQLVFVDGINPDAGFSFSILANPTFSLTSCETRLTCSEATSMFPDVVADSESRFHVVYQSNNSGSNQLYYVQIAPQQVGLKDDCDTNPPLNFGSGFGQVDVGTPGSVAFTDPSDPTTQVAFLRIGATGDFFTFGNRFLTLPSPNQGLFVEDRTGRHKLFRDFAEGDGKWTGISEAANRATWDAQIAALGSSATPDVVFGDGHPIAKEGDFGSRYDFDKVAFMIQTPPTAGVVVRVAALPLKPRCSPRGPAGTVELREQDLKQAPKRPLPPSFEDPIDLSQIVRAPGVFEDTTVPGRFVIEGDAGGTIFTNVVQQNANGELSRLVFRRESEKDDFKFVLGQQRCGDFPCGVVVSEDAGTNDSDSLYKVTLEVWQGSDYRFDPDQVASAQMGASKIYEKEFSFGPNANIASFVFEPGELVLPQGSVIFLVPVPGNGTEFSVEGVGGGNSIWSTDSSGLFENYNSTPFTLKPFSGLNAPVYYDGTLIEGQSDVVPSGSGDLVLNTRTATSAGSIAFGQAGSDDEDFERAYAVSQAFSLEGTRLIRNIIVRMAAGTSAGGSSDDADPDRQLVVEIVPDIDGVPGSEVLASATILAGDIRPFDDFEDVPSDSDMADVIVSLSNVELVPGTYHIVLREGGDADAGGRFWVLAAGDGQYPVGLALWNASRPVDAETWNLIGGQVQLQISLAQKESQELT